MNEIIDFDAIDEHGTQSYERTFDLALSEIAREEVAGAGNVTIRVKADRSETPDEYIAEGTVHFTADLECSRCVEPFPFANTSPFHVRFRPRPEASELDEEIEITDKEELDVEFYTERGVPLRHLALEQIQLSIPMKPLCEEGCLGLCPACGVNRSRQKCACGESIVDDRWGALKNIRDELSKKKDI